MDWLHSAPVWKLTFGCHISCRQHLMVGCLRDVGSRKLKWILSDWIKETFIVILKLFVIFMDVDAVTIRVVAPLRKLDYESLDFLSWWENFKSKFERIMKLDGDSAMTSSSLLTGSLWHKGAYNGFFTLWSRTWSRLTSAPLS